MELMLGTVQFGLDYGISNNSGKVSSSEIQKILNICHERGVRFLDTASMYGDSEERLGRAISEESNFNIVTKTPHLQELPSSIIKEVFYNSLNNLKKRSLYSLMFHSAEDLLSPNGEVFFKEALDLKECGLIKKIGCSVYTPKQLDYVLSNYDIDLIQLPMNVFDQRFYESGHLNILRKRNIEVHTRSLFLQGLVFCELSQLNSFFKPIKNKLKKFHEELNEKRISPTEGSFSFIKTFDEIDKVLVGVVSSKQLEESIEGLKTSHVNHFRDLSISDEKFINPSLWDLK